MQLGVWQSDQALTVIQALQAAGIRVRAQRVASGAIQVEVDAADERAADAVIGRLNPDPGPDAADQPAADAVIGGTGAETGTSASVAVPPGQMSPPPAHGDVPERPLLFERLRRLARPLGLVVAVMVAIVLAYRGPVAGAMAMGAVVVGVALWLANRRDDDGRYGPGS